MVSENTSESGAIRKGFSSLYTKSILKVMRIIRCLLVLCTVFWAGQSVYAAPENLYNEVAESVHFRLYTKIIQRAGLVDVFTDPAGSYTLLIPDDRTLRALPEGWLHLLLHSPEAATQMVLAHTVGGEYTVQQLITLDPLVNYQGEILPVRVEENIWINDAKVVHKNLPAGNGIIHMINRVFVDEDMLEFAAGFPVELPEPGINIGNGSIAGIVRGHPDMQAFAQAMVERRLITTLTRRSPLTVFVPTDEAFENMSERQKRIWANPENQRRILEYHILEGEYTQQDLLHAPIIRTMGGADIAFDSTTSLKVQNARLVEGDIWAVNGIIHTVDWVLFPPEYY